MLLIFNWRENFKNVLNDEIKNNLVKFVKLFK